ncbi:MAG: hypothetical protein U1F43_19915 [Myxococcota bacterium]
MMMFLSIWSLAALVAGAEPGGREPSPPADLYGVFRLDNGLVLPYPLDNLFRGWTECASRRGGHHALDIGGVGEDYGVGTPVRAMTRSKVVSFATTSSDPVRCGKPLKDEATTVRSQITLPTAKDIAGYGKVWFFSADYGAHRSGGFIALKMLDGPYEGATVRYLHLAAVRPDLKVGDIVEAGDEVALLGGTAVMDAPPHVHVQIETAQGHDLDVGKVLGIGSTFVGCKATEEATHEVRATYSAAAKKLMAALRATAKAEKKTGPAAACGSWTVDGDFDDGKVMKVKVPLPDGQAEVGVPWKLTLSRVDPPGKSARWQPRLGVTDLRGKPLFTGTLATKAAKRQVDFSSKASGKRGQAEVELRAKVDQPLVVEVSPWPVYKRWLVGARWRLTIERPCRTARP